MLTSMSTPIFAQNEWTEEMGIATEQTEAELEAATERVQAEADAEDRDKLAHPEKHAVPKQEGASVRREDKQMNYVYERESNDTFSSNDTVYVGDRMCATIWKAEDVDFFAIQYKEAGTANVRLHAIPAGCDYDMRIYDAGQTIIRSCTSGEGDQEAYFDVKPGELYYIRVNSFSGFDRENQYQIDFSLEGVSRASLFATTGNGIHTAPDIEVAMMYLKNMGYRVEPNRQPSVDELWSMEGASVVTLSGHADPDRIKFADDEHLKMCGVFNGKSGVIGDYDYVGIDELALNDCKLMIFAGCKTAGVSKKREFNIAQQTESYRGVETAIGWKEDIYSPSATIWLYFFFGHLDKGYTVFEAGKVANNGVKGLREDTSSLLSWEIYGNKALKLTLPFANRVAEAEELPFPIHEIRENVSVDIRGRKFTELEDYLSQNVEGFAEAGFQVEEDTLEELDSGYGSVDYSLRRDGYQMPYSITVICRDGMAKSYMCNFKSGEELRMTKRIAPADSLEPMVLEEIKELAAANVETDLGLTEYELGQQKVEYRIDTEEIPYVLVSTTVYYEVDGERFSTLSCFTYDL